jgi:NADPH:quinone reductase-like Zn-dependent oxidoreductase
MKAIVLENMYAPLLVKEVPDLKAGAGEAIVKIKTAAFNHRDWWIQKGQYAGLKYPCILGSDGAGIVTEVGEGVDTNWLNKAVIINPGINWGNNPKAHSKDFRILGLPDDGTFAEYVKIPATQLYHKPAHLSFEEAAALPLAGLTGYRALFSRAEYSPDEKLLITGIGGGVALTILQFAVAAGGKVYVTSGSEDKIEKAVELGAIGGVNYKHEEWYKDLQQLAGGNFDVIIDSAAGEGFAKLIEISNVGGRLVFFGGTKGNIKEIVPGRAFWKQLSMLGTTMGNDQEFKDMVKFVEEKQIKPIIDKVFPMSEAEQALRRMDDARQFGKIILKIEE